MLTISLAAAGSTYAPSCYLLRADTNLELTRAVEILKTKWTTCHHMPSEPAAHASIYGSGSIEEVRNLLGVDHMEIESMEAFAMSVIEKLGEQAPKEEES